MTLHAMLRRRVLPLALVAMFVASAAGPVTAQTDLDALMARVLTNREQSWRQLQEYLLDEREHVELVGPDATRLYGMHREFVWVARDGVAVRSPVRFDGVTLSDADRRTYEAEWARDEARRQEKATGQIDPRFISEASFLVEFRFEPGNYYLAGRETLAGIDVLRIEYYPTRMFPDKTEPGRTRDEDEARIDAAFNKATLVTLWVDPAEQQIVRFTFDNIDFSFLPGQALARVNTARASMTMGQPFAGIWLPTDVTVEGEVTLANGAYRATYRREFRDYRRGDVKVRFQVKP